MTVQVQNGCGVSVVYTHDPVHDWEKVSYHILLARGKIKIQNLKCRFLFLLNAYHFCNIIQSNHLKNRPSCLPILGVRQQLNIFPEYTLETREIGVCTKTSQELGTEQRAINKVSVILNSCFLVGEKRQSAIKKYIKSLLFILNALNKIEQDK